MVGPHVTDLIEAGVVAIDAEATVETVADGMTAHPTLSEAIKEAGLVALGRAIHLPNRKRAPAHASVALRGLAVPLGALARCQSATDDDPDLFNDTQASRPSSGCTATHVQDVYRYALMVCEPRRCRGRRPDNVPEGVPRVPER